MSDLRYLEIDYETSPVDGQLVRYNATTGLWEPVSRDWTDLTVSPTLTGGPTFANIVWTYQKYRYLDPNTVEIIYKLSFDITANAGKVVTITIPVNSPGATNEPLIMNYFPSGGTYTLNGCVFISAATTLTCRQEAIADWIVGAGHQIFIKGSYRI